MTRARKPTPPRRGRPVTIEGAAPLSVRLGTLHRAELEAIRGEGAARTLAEAARVAIERSAEARRGR